MRRGLGGMFPFCSIDTASASRLQALAVAGPEARGAPLSEGGKEAAIGWNGRLSCNPWGGVALVCALSGAAFEVLEVLAHLLEGKTQSEEALGHLRTKVARQTLVAQLVDLRRVSIKSGFDRIPWRWPTPGTK